MGTDEVVDTMLHPDNPEQVFSFLVIQGALKLESYLNLTRVGTI